MEWPFALPKRDLQHNLMGPHQSGFCPHDRTSLSWFKMHMRFGKKERSPGFAKVSGSGMAQTLADLAHVVAEVGDHQKLPTVFAQVE
jgi:hypothetical protein